MPVITESSLTRPGAPSSVTASQNSSVLVQSSRWCRSYFKTYKILLRFAGLRAGSSWTFILGEKAGHCFYLCHPSRYQLYTLLRTAYLYAHHSSICFPFLRVCSSLLYRRKKDRSFTFSPVRCSQLILTYTCIGHIRTSKNITNDIVSEYSNQYIGKPSMATRPIHAPQRFYHQGAEKGDDRVSPCRGNRCKRVCPRDTRNLTRAFLSGSSTR